MTPIHPVRIDLVQRAIARSVSALEAVGSEPEAVLARFEMGTAGPEELARAETAVVDRQASDGSWGGDVVTTSSHLLLLDELGRGAAPPNVKAAAAKAIVWLRSRQDQPGRFGAGCDPDRHRRGLCEHFTSGTFAQAAGAPTGSVSLPGGTRVAGEASARLVASCLALQAMLRWEQTSRAIELHLDLVERLLAERGREAPVTPAFLAGAAALLEAPPSPTRVAAVERTFERAARAQRADGSWPDADLFHALDVLNEVHRRGHTTTIIGDAIRRGAGSLAVAQQRDGSWGRDGGARRLLIAIRALSYAAANRGD